MAKGGGSANKSFLFQETKAVPEPEQGSTVSTEDPLAGHRRVPALPPGGGDRHRPNSPEDSEIRFRTISTPAHRGIDVGARLPRHRARGEIFSSTSRSASARSSAANTSATTRAIRLPRHGRRCRSAIAVSCSADRQALGKITADGVFLEQLETDPAVHAGCGVTRGRDRGRRGCRIDLNRPMPEILAELGQVSGQDPPVADRSAGGGRDIAHAKIKGTSRRRRADARPSARCPSITPVRPRPPRAWRRARSVPTTAGRMDSYVEQFQAAGGSMVMLAKGNRSKGSPMRATRTAASISDRSAVRPPALASVHQGQEIIIPRAGNGGGVEDRRRELPAFIVVDDKGNDFHHPGGAVTVPWVVRVRSRER